MIIGVLALQGGVAEHLAMLEGLGVRTRRVRLPRDLEGLDGIILPGGESTVMDKLARALDLAEPLSSAIRAGLPVLATCAGLIYLARELENPAPGQRTLGVLDVTVRRNAFGSQRDSFDTRLDVSWPGTTLDDVHASFIRAPLVTSCGPGVDVVATCGAPGASGAPGAGVVVGVRQAMIIAVSFHPEESGDDRLHRAWLELIATGASTGPGGGSAAEQVI